jgi:hypothetical protein
MKEPRHRLPSSAARPFDEPEEDVDPSMQALAADIARWYVGTPTADDARERLLSRLHDRGAEARPSRREAGRAGGAAQGRRGILTLAAAAALVALLARSGDRTERPTAPAPPALPTPTAAASAASDVGFVLQLADVGVRHVALAGDFNGWDPAALPMQRDPATGTWRARVRLVPGRHEYSYVVNGTRWIIDPLAPRTMEQAMGPANVITVPGDL